MKRILSLLSILTLTSAVAPAAESVTITVTHDLAIARPAETITVPWAEVARALPGALLQKIAVKDTAGRVLPYQVTNVAPQAKDPENKGVAYGELIFQYDFSAGEQSAKFTVEKTSDVSPVFPTKAFARYVPERLDDFAWENDKVAHRTYGTALGEAITGTPKEVLITSGLDIWSKRVSYPIVDRWYNKGHDHYHHDEGEGMDMYQVGVSRGCGGTGVWDGKTLHTSRNYKSWKVIANGPVRAIFELTYENWNANGTYVAETKRFTVDAGHNLDRIDSTFTVAGAGAKEIVVGVGLNKKPADKGQDEKITTTPVAADGSLTQWVEQKTNGALGTAIIVPTSHAAAEDERNQLLLAKVAAGGTLTYYAGAGWSRAGEFTTAESWNNYVAACAARAKSPVRVTLNQ